MPRIAQGETLVLNVTKEARERVFVGLGWDPNERVSLKDKALSALGVKDTHHDLDLSCYIFDQNKRYIGHVSHEPGRDVDQTGQIYHSGDNVEGVGDGDDEQVSVELKNLDPAIHFILFKASIKTGQTFDQVNDPEIRLVDGYSGHNFLHVSLADLSGNAASAFIFMCLIRNKNEGWDVRHIGKFTAPPKDGDWPKALKAFI